MRVHPSMLSAAILAGTLVSTTVAGDVAGAATTESRFTVLLMGNSAGTQTTRIQPDGELHVAFEYTARGRGPKLETVFELDDRGLPSRLENRGNDYLKAPVEETFALEDGKAVWRNQGEQGSRELTGLAFYIGINDPPEMLAVLARAL